MLLASIAILATGGLAHFLAPRAVPGGATTAQDLSTIIPERIGGWQIVRGITLVSPEADGEAARPEDAQIYSQELARGYSDAQGNVVMLLVAYGPVQDSKLMAHLPEVCYTANGFRITSKSAATFRFNEQGREWRITRLTAARESRLERVSYWMRVGDGISNGVVDRQLIRIRYGLRGLIPDGALIRVSTIGLSAEAAATIQSHFVHDLLNAVRPENRRFLIGI